MQAKRASGTAEAVCLMRAAERLRPAAARVLDDPHAELFLGPVARAALASLAAGGRLSFLADRLSPRLSNWVVCRHRWIDDRLHAALGRGVAQVLILGAGYDTRAQRFHAELAGRPVFEVDHPATSRRKRRILEANRERLPPSHLVQVEVDFERDSMVDRLAEAGFTRGGATFVVWEGVTPYLTREAVKATLADLRAIVGEDSEIAVDFYFLIDSPSFRATAFRFSANLLAFVGEPVTFAIHPEDAPSFLARSGWEVEALAGREDLERLYLTDGRRIQSGLFLVAARPRSVDSASVAQ